MYFYFVVLAVVSFFGAACGRLFFFFFFFLFLFFFLFFFFFFPYPVCYFRPSFSLPRSRKLRYEVTQQALLPPFPLRFVRCIFIARMFQLFLPSSTPVELCFATLLKALSGVGVAIQSRKVARVREELILFYFLQNIFNFSRRRDSNSRTNAINTPPGRPADTMNLLKLID